MPDEVQALIEASAQTRAHDNVAAAGMAVPQPFLMPFVRPKSDLDLPRWGYAGRDWMLGRAWKLPGADLVGSAIAVMSQKVESTDYNIEGPDRTVNSRCRPLLENAEYGKGWLTFVCKWVQDYCTYDNGVFVELISDAPPMRYYDAGGKPQRFIDGDVIPDLAIPRSGPIIGIAVMDATRCARTRDINYPVRYFDMQGRTHLIHRSRIYFTSDMPSTEEWLFDYGYCAVSRCLATLQYGVNWALARNEMLDNMPPLQYLAISGANKDDFIKQQQEYQAQRQALGEFVLRSVFTLFSSNADKPITFQTQNIRQLWESFDEKESLNVSIDLVCMAFGLDHQDLAPLASSSMGSGAQSTVLDEKTVGKGPGHIRAKIEQMIKSIFPASCRFAFDYQNDKADLQRGQILNTKMDAIGKVYALKRSAPVAPITPVSSPVQIKVSTLTDIDNIHTQSVSDAAPPPPDEYVVTNQQVTKLLMKEIPEWATILDPDGSITGDVTVNELTPRLQAENVKMFGPRVRYNRKSGKATLLKSPRVPTIAAPVTDAELLDAAAELAALGIDVGSVRTYAPVQAGSLYNAQP